MNYAFIVFENEDMAEDALKRFNGKPKPYFQRPFKINWGIKKAIQPQPQSPGAQPPTDQFQQRNNLNSFLTPNSFNLLNQSSSPMDESQRIQAETLKALGLSREAQYQPTPLSTTNTAFDVNANTGHKNKNIHPMYTKKRVPLEINPETYNPDSPISIYVGDLDRNCDFLRLENTFKQFYTTVVGAKIIKDATTRVSKGYGFVMFASPEEADLAIEEMYGFQIMNRKIRTGKSIVKNGMAPTRGSGNGCGIIGNGLSSGPGPKNLGTTPFEGGEKNAKGQSGVENMGYPGMMMFNSMGYPVSYSQYYNFNMINMPFPYLQSAEAPELAQNMPDMHKQMYAPMAPGHMGDMANVFPAYAEQPNVDVMAAPFYPQNYQQMYVPELMYSDMRDPREGAPRKNSDKRGSVLGKRSGQSFQNQEKIQKKHKANKKKNLAGVQKKAERTRESEEARVGTSFGWFEPKRGDPGNVSVDMRELVTRKFDWFSTGGTSCNKFVLEFFGL